MSWREWLVPVLLILGTMANVGCDSPRERWNIAAENEAKLRCFKVLNRIQPPMALNDAAIICEEAAK
jgi:hypothetical protein